MTATCEREGECNYHFRATVHSQQSTELPCEGWQALFCALVEKVADDDADDDHI